MNKYKLIIEDSTNAYILNKEKNKIVALCNIKRPDLEFNELKELIKKANKNSLDGKNKQLLQLGNIVYFVDDDYGFFEEKINNISLDLNKQQYEYSTDSVDFFNEDIGHGIFKSKKDREDYMKDIYIDYNM